MQLRFVNRTNMAVCVLVLKNAKCFVVAYKISWAHYLFSPPLGGTVTLYCLSLCYYHTCWALMVETVMQIDLIFFYHSDYCVAGWEIRGK